MNIYPMNQEMVLSHLTMEQRHLHCRLQKIQKLFMTECNKLPTTQHVSELHREMVELRQELETLFRAEIAGGLLEEAITQRPAIGPHVVALNQEQPKLLAETDRLMIFCQRVPESYEQWQVLGEQFHDLKRRLCEHELQNARLVQEGFNFDCQELLD
jgi:hypothetical protein